MNAEPLIELTDVDVTHAERPLMRLVSGVNWQICPGEFWAVGGDQGTGKSSLLATAASLNRPAGGTLRFFGGDFSSATEQDQIGWRRRIGYVFDNGGRLFGHLSVAENVGLPLQYHRDLDDATAQAQVDVWLARVEMSAYADAAPNELPLRLQQRVALLRAVAAGPEVLFLDMPLSGVAPREGRWWLALLRDLQKEQTARGTPLTVIATCDDFLPWRDTAGQFAIIDRESFRVIGDRAALLASREPAILDLLQSEN